VPDDPTILTGVGIVIYFVLDDDFIEERNFYSLCLFYYETNKNLFYV